MFKQQCMNDLNILRQGDEEGLKYCRTKVPEKLHLAFKQKQVLDVPLLLGADKG